MKLRERYRGLTFWKKLGVWGSIASIISLVLVIFKLLLPITPSKNVSFVEVFDKPDRRQQNSQPEALVTRTFWLLRDKGSTISLGPCPGEKCLYFELGELEQRHGKLVQQIFLGGEGLGINWNPEQNILFSFDNLIVGKGAHPGISLKDKRFFALISITKGAYFEVFADVAHVKFWVLDTRTDSLRIKLEIKPPNRT